MEDNEKKDSCESEEETQAQTSANAENTAPEDNLKSENSNKEQGTPQKPSNPQYQYNNSGFSEWDKNGNWSQYNYNNSQYNYNGYGQRNTVAKNPKFLIILISSVAVLLIAAIIGIGIFFNQVLKPLLGQIELNNPSIPTLPSNAEIIDGDFNLTQSNTPGKAYDSLAEAYDATHAIFAEINTSSEKDGSMGAGSGFLVARMKNNEGYYIVTNNHVVEGATKITVRLSNGKEYLASSTVLRDEFTDLAVIAIAETADLPVAKLGKSSNIRVGEDVYVIGNPLGTLAGTLTNGIVSSKAAEIYMNNHFMSLIQTTAAINPGNSGGPIFNMSGEVIGVVNSKYAGTGIEGLGFAIPMDTVIGVVEDMVKQGYVTGRHDLGIVTADNIYGTGGLWISEIEEDSALLTKNLITNNTLYAYEITAIDGMPCTSAIKANYYFDGLQPGDTVTITVNVYEVYFSKFVKLEENKQITVTLGQKLATN